MLEKIDTKRLVTDITETLKAKGIQFHKEKVFHHFLEPAEPPMGWVRLDTWVYSSFLVRPEEMVHLYELHVQPTAMMMQRCLDRCARSRALLPLTSHEPITDVIGKVVGDYDVDHVQGINVNFEPNMDVIGSVVEIGDQRFTVIEYDERQIHIDPPPNKPITTGSEIRAGFRHAHVDLTQGGVTVVSAPLPLQRGSHSVYENFGVNSEHFEVDDFLGRSSVTWKTSESESEEGRYHVTIDLLCGFIVDPEKCQLVK